jgi:hypothetical protein
VTPRAKARSSEATQRPAPRLRPFFRAFAIRGASSDAGGAGARSAGTHLTLTLALGCVLVAIGLFLPGAASAAWTRPFLRQIAGTCPSPGTCAPTEVIPFSGPRGLSVDAEDNLWVSDPRLMFQPYPLDEFEPSGATKETLKIKGLERPPSGFTSPDSLAINQTAGSFYGSFYITGPNTGSFSSHFVEVFGKTGAFSIGWGPLEYAEHVAVDNSTGPTAGSVYVVTSEGVLTAVHKFDSEGKEKSFSRAEEPNPPSYLSGNKIIGRPGESFAPGKAPLGIAVDAQGDIYAVNDGAHGGTAPEVDEYSLSGLFIQAFTGKETPGLGESHAGGGWGSRTLNEVAADPLSGHLLVSLTREGEHATEGAIDEFDSSGHFLSQIVQTSSVEPLHGPSTMTVDSHGDLYVIDAGNNGETKEHAVDAYGPGHFLPSLKLAEAGQRKPNSAVLSGEVDPEGFPLTQCAFEYVTDVAFQKTGFSDLSSGGSAPCASAASIPVDKSFHPVEAALTGLTSGVTYRYRLVATSSGELGGTAESGVLAFTAPSAPTIDSTTATNLSSTFVDLRAQIDPRGADTSYQFQYVDQAHYQPAAEDPYAAGTTAPVIPADIGSGGATGGADASVLQQLGGLAPGTTYHFRVLAVNEVGATAGPDATLTTLPQVVPGLPDGRAYELVTPPNKGSAGDMFGAAAAGFQNFENFDPGYASETGEQFFLETNSAFGSFPASGHNAYVFTRDPEQNKWTYTSLASPSLGVQSIPLVGAFDPFDLSQVGMYDTVGSQGSPTGFRGTSLLGPPGGPYATLHADAPVHGEEHEDFEQTKIYGGSRDLSHVVLESKDHTLAAGAKSQYEGSHSLYEYSAGELRLVNVKSNGALLNRCGAELGQGIGALDGGWTHNAVSTDGSRVFFTAPDPKVQNAGAECWNGASANTPQLYLRSAGQTVEVSAPEVGAVDPSGRHPAIYVGASEDGSRVFFISEGELTKDDAGIHDPEMYEWESQGAGGCSESSPAYNPASKGCLTRVSAGESGKAAAAVFAVPAVSADGSAVYFMARGQLTATAAAVFGKEQLDLYRYDTVSGATAYVGMVEERDYPDTATGEWWPSAHLPTEVGLPTEVALAPEANWYTTPDGRFLLFATRSELTGYSTAEAIPPLKPGAADCPVPNQQNSKPTGHCTEVYRYDAANGGSLACVSCNPSGAQPTSNAFFNAGQAAGLGVASVGAVRAMSDDGSYAFFDSADALVPQDGNGTLDVYEWHDGHISLISSGHDPAPSFFLSAGSDGRDVFFGTHSRLVPQDGDSAGDVYDARICTESDPCVKPPAGETAQCEGGACQTPPPPPIDPTPGSLTFSGAGNLVSELASPPAPTKKTIKCSKGKKLSHGKCVKCSKGKKLSHGKCLKSKSGKKAKATKAGGDRRAKR